ncbi:MAG: hypothetical protein DBY30_00025 [Verrucomicrobia bacterium]|nr:MAG: hypothetical protein DBY30_00025 [Verrucomicrobiota bacterium]
MAETEPTEPTEEIVETQIKDLDPRFVKQLESAERSIDKNPGYTIDICATILAKYPSCVDVRKIMRQAQFKKYGKGNPVAKLSGDVQGMVLSMKAPSMIKKGQALEVMAQAEHLLSQCPQNASALKALASAAESLSYWGTAASAYMAIAQFQPKNEKNLLALANAYVKNKQPDEAAQVCEQILRRNPSNGDAQALARSASVIKTMNKGNWEKEGGDFRDKLKSADETSDLEKAASLVSDEETLGRMVDRLREQIKTDPENVNLYREICANLRTLRRYSEALEYVRQARQQPLGKGDTTLEKWEHDFIVADMENKIETLKAKLEENPDDAATKAELEELSKKEHDYKLENARLMVERYPNDFNYRYIYGQLLFEDGKLDDAIMQFQLSQRNPKVRLQSLLGLGRAFILGAKYDLAVDQLEIAKKESKIMNDAKKEIIYELATAYEKMGEAEKAFNEFKEIYSADISYKDVSKKINDYYESKRK